MKETGYQWWVNRIAYQSKIYDVIRIDHFRGFDEYYAIPYGDSTAKNGYWKPGPGMDLFTTIENKLGKLPIIAEDLGFLTRLRKTAFGIYWVSRNESPRNLPLTAEILVLVIFHTVIQIIALYTQEHTR